MNPRTVDPVMMRIPVLAIACCIAVLFAGFLVCPPAAGAQYVVAPSGGSFTSIQNAVTWASPLDTIVVNSGTYPGTVKIDKRITLIGVDTGGGAPVIDPGRKGTAVEIDANNVTVEGFVIQNSAEANGILVASSGNSISNNTLTGNAVGIQISSAQSNSVTGNIISANSRAGIVLKNAQDNLIFGNRVTNNAIGISIDELSTANIIYFNSFSSNTANVVSRGTGQQWASPSGQSYTYMGLPFIAQLGNYWSDYRGSSDQNSNGIGSVPYVIRSDVVSQSGSASSGNEVDPDPLMDPIAYYLQVRQAAPGTGMTAVSTPAVTANPPGPGTSPREPESPAAGDRTGRDLLTIGILVLLIVIIGAGCLLFIRGRTRSNEDVPVPPVSIMDTRPRQIPETHEGDGGSVYGKPPLDTGPAETAPTLETEVVPAPRETPPSSGPKFYFPPELESRYGDIRHIGRGGVAQVFAAHRKSDNLLVAVKIPISFDEVTGKCFLNEIAAWQTLRHKNIVEVLEVNILPVPYVEMEYVPGSLESVEKPLPVWKAVHLVHGIADGLAYAHAHGIIHRDIKPHNILVTSDFVPKITDWGMSKVIATTMDKSSVAGFSLSYAAPEQVSPAEFGRTDIRTDIYQLGALFYELVTGTIPFGGESIVEVGNAIVRDEPVPPTEYNPDAEAVEKIILRCLAKNPADRYQSADELLDALSRYLDEDEE